MSTEQDLMPCPFCGGTAQFVERYDNSSSFVQCDSMIDEHSACCAQGPIGIQDDDGEETPGEAAAIRAWNERVLQAARQQAAVDHIADAGKMIKVPAELARRAAAILASQGMAVWDQVAADLLDALAAAAPQAEQCDTCHGQGEVWTGENAYQGHMQPPEPIMEECPECGGEEPQAEQECGCCGRTDTCDEDCDARAEQVVEPGPFACEDKDLERLLNATAAMLEFPGQDSGTYWGAMLANVEDKLTTPPTPDVSGLLNRIVPRIDAGGPNPIDPDLHCCEWTLHQERERIHAEFSDALAAHKQEGKRQYCEYAGCCSRSIGATRLCADHQEQQP